MTVVFRRHCADADRIIRHGVRIPTFIKGHSVYHQQET